MASPDTSDKWFCVYASLQVLLVIPIVVLACLVTAPLSGAHYYTLGEEGFGPSCRAIIYPVTKQGMKIELMKFGGGRIANFTYVSPLLAIERVHGQTSVDIASAPVMHSDECKLVFAADLILNGATGQQVPMPSECGGVTPGVWQDGGSDWEGVWVTPLILGTVGWGLLRCALLIIKYMKLESGDTKFNVLFAIPQYLVKMSAMFLLLPVSNIKMSDVCPQILASYYSGTASLVLNAFLLVGVPCLLCCGACLACVLGGLGEGGGDFDLDGEICIVGIFGSGVTCYLCWLVPVIVFYIYLVDDFAWS